MRAHAEPFLWAITQVVAILLMPFGLFILFLTYIGAAVVSPFVAPDRLPDEAERFASYRKRGEG